MEKSSFCLTGVALLLLTFAAPATAEDCEAHAAAMVAEMQASRTEPLSEAEIALIRETALKSCRVARGDVGEAQDDGTAGDRAAPSGEAEQPGTSAGGEAAAAGEPAAEKKEEKKGFWSGLAEKMKTPYHEKEGNERLKKRGTGQP